MNALSQYFTNDLISKLLVSSFQQNSPRYILDLGVGNGSLINAAYYRWRNANFIGIDIDDNNFSEIYARIPDVNLVNLDSLSFDLPQKLNLKIGTIDIAICNPPYIKIKKNTSIIKLLKEVNLHKSTNLLRFTSDILFLAQNLLMLKKGGELGIILPDTIFTGHEFEYLRKDLIYNHKVLAVIQLPDKIFQKTEAKTHILFLEKDGITQSSIPLFLSDRLGNIISKLYISKYDLIYRMDYDFHSWKLKFNYKSKNTLSTLLVEIKRGKISKNDLDKKKYNYFHTSSFPSNIKEIIYLPYDPLPNYVNAEPGDLLLARVGKRSIGKVTKVGSGSLVITDCVYRIRAHECYRDKIWNSLISDRGQDWLKAHSHGVCAQVISKRDLLNFPV